jgi:hypothetical protein
MTEHLFMNDDDDPEVYAELCRSARRENEALLQAV